MGAFNFLEGLDLTEPILSFDMEELIFEVWLLDQVVQLLYAVYFIFLLVSKDPEDSESALILLHGELFQLFVSIFWMLLCRFDKFLELLCEVNHMGTHLHG